MIIRQGNFHWNTIIKALHAEDSGCNIEYTGSTFTVSLEQDSKRPTLEAILDSHDADAALVTWNARQNRIANAADGIRNIPNWATWTPQEAEAWIELNVISLATAKIVLKKLAIVVCYLRDHGGIV